MGKRPERPASGPAGHRGLAPRCKVVIQHFKPLPPPLTPLVPPTWDADDRVRPPRSLEARLGGGSQGLGRRGRGQ